jgi:uncharacterized DUF497 family protein
MQFEWDEKKAKANLAKHGVDFESIRDFDFDTAYYAMDDAMSDGEERWQAIGQIGLRVYTLIFTERGDRRAISLRKASSVEIRTFYER